MGRKTQKQTTAGNCPESVKTKQVNCPYVGPWIAIGGCGADGKQYYRRDVVNSTASMSKSENCCFIGAWGGWTPSGDCNGSKRPHTRTRAALNCPSGTATTENKQRNCNHCEGKWENTGAVTLTNCRRGFRGPGTCTRMQKVTYKITKPVTNGGRACPHQDGETKQKNLGSCSQGYPLRGRPHC